MAILTRILAGVALICALAATAPMSVASEITDSPEPFGVANLAVVGVFNGDPVADRGLVEVTAVLSNGATATKSAGFQLDPNESVSMSVVFKYDVVQILESRIIDSAEPF